MGGRHDFDFLIGREWTVENRELAERLAGCTVWEGFEASLTNVQPILGGLGNVDRFETTRRGQHFHATSVRIYDPAANLWRIYWADTFGLQLFPQVEGRFADGVGTFEGEELFRGRMTPLRFLWTELDTETPLWEQAYLDDSTGEWETNWTMRFLPR